MILKGVPLAPVARAWRADVAATATSPAASAPVESAPTMAAPRQPVASPVPATQPLTADRVLDWLCTQNAETRKQVAAELAEDIDRLNAEAQQQGRESGEQSARAQVQRELASVLKAMHSVRTECEREYQRAAAALEQQVADIVLAVLEKLLGRAAASAAGVSGAVKEILAGYAPEGRLNILVSAQDYQLLRELDAQFVELLGAARYELRPDHRVQLGGCLIESAHGEIDGRLEVQLEQLYRTIIAHKTTAEVAQVTP